MQLGALEYLISLNSSNLGSDIKKADKTLTSWAVAKGQLIGRTLERAMAAAGKSLKKVVGGAFSSFADYEQLTGGVETLFKKSADQVKKYAEQAYKTAGISANQYMETVTSFSASLLQSLGGDTAKAADYADMAVKDMSDNANKMGSSMESIQNAYQGFAKQNYTMLDNLKLGYGGTKGEMERLLTDAGKLANKTFDIKNLSDVYEAIHVIQEEMGIFGTTQKEAEGTISGSINSAKAAWSDLLTAMGSGQNVPEATKRFAKSAQTVIKNATPVISRTISSMLIAAKNIWPDVKTAITDIWKSTLDTITSLMPKSIQGLIKIGKTIISRLTSAFKQDGLKGIARELKTAGKALQTSIARMLKIDNPDTASWGQIGTAVVQSIKDKIAGADVNWGEAAQKIAGKLKSAFNGAQNSLKLKVADILGLEADGDIAWSTIGQNILTRIKNGFTTGETNLRLKIADLLGLEADGDQSWKTIGQDILTRIKNGFTSGEENLRLKVADLLGIESTTDPSWGTIAGKIKAGIKSGIKSAKMKLADLLGFEGEDVTWSDIGGKIAEGLGNAFTKGKSMLFKLILGDEYKEGAGLTEVGEKLGDFVKKGFEAGGWADTFIQNFGDKLSGIVSFAGKAIEGISEWLDSEENVNLLVSTITKAIDVIANAIDDIVTPLSNALIKVFTNPDIISAISTSLTSLTGAITNLLVGVITSPDLWAGLGVLADNVLRSILGDNAISFLLGPKKKLESYTDDKGQTHVRAVEDKEAKKEESVITKLLRGFFGSEQGTFGDNLVRWLGGDTDIFSMIFGEDKISSFVDHVSQGLNDIKMLITGEAHLNLVIDGYGGFPGDVSTNLGDGAAHTIDTSGRGNPKGPTFLADPGGVSYVFPKAKGDWNVPYDNFPALLHRNEMVLTSSQARRYRDGGDDINYAVVGGLIGNAVESAMSRVYVMMSGDKVGDLTTKRVRNNMNASSYNKLRALGG